VRTISVSGPLGPRDLAALCERVRRELAGTPGATLVCDVRELAAPEAGTVGALARLQLTARRLGCDVRLRGPSPELCELLDLCGLAEVLRVEARGQPEQREQPLRVQERVEMGDPPVL